MPINTEQLSDLIERTLKEVDLYSPAAVNLLLLTAAQESHMGTYIRQLGNGPALGVFQMEPATHDDIWENYLDYKYELSGEVLFAADMTGNGAYRSALEYNLKYAILMARMQYRRRPEPLPAADDIRGLAAYWKQWYNTPLGAGTEEEAMLNYKRFVLGEEE